MRPGLVLLGCFLAIGPAAAEDPAETQVLLLSGRGPSDAVRWEFRCEKGRGCGDWTTIPVPSNWELEGFGAYDYGHVEDKAPDVGHYRRRVAIPAGWAGRTIDLVVGGAMTDTEVAVNGRAAGPVHRGGFTEFRHDVSALVRPGEENLFELTVHESSADRSVELAERDADYWTFGGVYRPVWLESRPPESIDHVAIDARHDGTMRVVVRLRGVRDGTEVVGWVTSPPSPPLPDGRGGSGDLFRLPLPPGRGGEGRGEGGLLASVVELSTRFPSPRPWSDEDPALYALTLELRRGDVVLHRVSRRFGFRTVEVRPGDGLYVNGVRRLLRGVNRHIFRPASGRALDPADSRADAERIQAMNLNAVRASHYPPEPAFLDACDELGLYVIDELPGWHDAYSTVIGRGLVRELVERDVHHPSVILWANGNEGGSNPALDAVFHEHDLERRPVLHPDAVRSGVDTHHYPTWRELVARLDPRSFLNRRRALRGPPPVYLPTEALHALYDGGGGAGLARYWEAIRRSPLGAGLFLWSFADESVVRTDRAGVLDSDGNHAPDGLLGPRHERTGSEDAVRAIFSPIQISLSEDRLGEIEVENRTATLDLAAFTFHWHLLRLWPANDGRAPLAAGVVQAPPMPAGARGVVDLPLPDGWQSADALAVAAVDPGGREVQRRVFPLRTRRVDALRRIAEESLVEESTGASATTLAEESAGASATTRVEESAGTYRLIAGDAVAEIDAATGVLRALERGPTRLPLPGPAILGAPGEAGPVAVRRLGDATVEAMGSGGLVRLRWTLEPSGWLRLTTLSDAGGSDLDGIAFALPADTIRRLRYLGDGPGRIWGNRREGVDHGLWEKVAGAATTFGSVDDLPGFYGGVRWMQLATTAGTLELLVGSDDVDIGVSSPAFPSDAKNAVASLPPRDSLTLVHRLPSIGTKFHAPNELEPAESPSARLRTTTVWLRVR